MAFPVSKILLWEVLGECLLQIPPVFNFLPAVVSRLASSFQGLRPSSQHFGPQTPAASVIQPLPTFSKTMVCLSSSQPFTKNNF